MSKIHSGLRIANRQGGFLLACFLAHAAIFATLMAAEPAKLLPRPTGDALAKAEAAMRELFDADLARATKPSEKAALARTMIDVAKADVNPDRNADRFALLMLARETAIEGRDRTAAFDASRAIAERYEPGEKAKAFEKGQELWKSAGAKAGTERLAIEVAAAEWFVYALPMATSLNKVLIERRLATEPILAASPQITSKTNDTKTLLGVWSIVIGGGWNATWTFQGDGTAISVAGNEKHFGTWVAKKAEIRINWDNGCWETLKRPLDAKGSTGDSWSGPDRVRAVKR